jgi:hypothetical protein
VARFHLQTLSFDVSDLRSGGFRHVFSRASDRLKFSPAPELDEKHPVTGSWIIGEEAGRMGIREDSFYITGNLSRFVPHYTG